MQNTKYLFILICLLFLSAFNAFGQKNTIGIGYLSNSPDNVESCGTRLKFAVNPGGANVFFSADETLMKLNGKMVNFKFVESNESESGETEVGKTFWRSYGSEKFDLKINFKVTGYSDNNVFYRGTITITNAKSVRKVRFVGLSGC